MTATTRTPDDPTYRSVTLAREAPMHYRATNVRGGSITLGTGEDADFTPVELLLVALAGCGAIDLEHVLARRADLTGLDVRAEGHKIRDEQGNRMVDLLVTLAPGLPAGPDGDAARAVLERTVRQVQDRLCTVGRTVRVGDPVRYVADTSSEAARDV